MANQHIYEIDLKWSGSTEDIRAYNRAFSLTGSGKDYPIEGSSDSYSRGDAKKWNPEEMLLASIASCHMLWYLYLCANANIIVTEYQDHISGILNIDPAGKSRFIEATLSPRIVISDPFREEEALELQHKAHGKCYIVNSVNFEVKLSPQVLSKEN